MTKRIALLLAPVLVAWLVGCASNGSDGSVPEATVASKNVQGKDRVEFTDTVRMTAVVDAIDLAKREVRLRGPGGRKTTLTVDESVKNLPQVKVGDEISVTYVESLVFQVRKPGEATLGSTGGAALATAKPGQRPAGEALATITVTTLVEAIDKQAKTITLKTADGETRALEVQNPANLEKVKVGDMLDITYSKALAIAVEAPPTR
jgi:Cu/Ag efflux protein CusF